MALIWDGITAFLEAVGLAAVLWILSDWILRPGPRIEQAVYVPLTGDASELEPLLRRLAGLNVVLLDEGLSVQGRQQVEKAALERPHITLKKRGETHGGTQHD